MQDKLTLYINKDIKQEYPLDHIVEKSILFSIKETSYLSFVFETEKNSEFSVECYQAKIGDKEVEIENDFLVCQPSAKYQILGGELYYFPGIYRILYHSGNGDKQFFFKVERNSQVSKDGFDIMVERLETLLKGLAYNRERGGIIIQDEDVFFPLYHNLEQNYVSFQKLLKEILFSLKEDIADSYMLSSHCGKQNSVSIRMNLIHPHDGKQYIRKKVLTYDTKENRSICYSLKGFQRKLEQSLDLLQDVKKRLCLSIEEDEKQIVEIDQKLKKSGLFSRFLKNKQISVENELKKKEEEKQFYERLNNLLCSYQHQCVLFFNDSKIKSVQFTYSSSFFKDEKVRKVKELHNRIFSNKNSSVSYKPTNQIFEFYGYYMIHSVLTDLGYELDDTNVNQYSDFRENQSYFFYENETRIVRVLYGPFCENFYETKSKDKTVSINSRHCSPDFILEFFDKKNNTILKEIILEVKYIPLGKFDKSDSLKKDIIETASDYLQFGYLSQERLALGVVKKVFFLFPSKDERIQDLKRLNYIYLLGLNVEKEVASSQIYEFLKSNFEE